MRTRGYLEARGGSKDANLQGKWRLGGLREIPTWVGPRTWVLMGTGTRGLWNQEGTRGRVERR